MKYLKKVKMTNGNVEATLKNGKKTNDRTIAAFFMLMDDKNANKSEVKDYIKIGRMTDPLKPWDEIEGML